MLAAAPCGMAIYLPEPGRLGAPASLGRK